MQVVTIDFETFWDTDHTLSKMSPMAYVMSPRTQLISMAIKVDAGDTEVFFGEDKIRGALATVDWDGAMALGHNMSGFDSMILAWRLGIRPKMWGCTLAMARPLHSKTCGNSLGKLVEHYKLGFKDQTALHNTKGKRLEDFTPAEIAAMGKYNKADTDQCYALFKKLRGHYSAKELWHIDASIRMLVEPSFVVDRPMLETALSIERDNKRKSILTLARHLRRTGLASDEVQAADTLETLEVAVKAELASAPKFAKVLESLDVPVPMKPSPTNPHKQVPALAKTDEAFTTLQDHENEVVAAAARARLAVKSTILETRISAFLEASAAVQGKLPVPLNYCGADTTGRWSGWAYNPQNLPRISPGKPKVSDALRNCLKAPKGYKVVVSDQSGIELRVNHFLWKVQASIDLYRQDSKADLYRAFAAARYQIPQEEVTKDQRQLAKVAQLGLGFGAGWRTFQKVAKLMGGLELSEEDAEAVTTSWRKEYRDIVQGWHTCHAALQHIYDDVEQPIDPWGLCVTCKEGIRLPSGRIIRYPALHIEQGDDGKPEWWYGLGRHRARIYAGKITENCIAEGTPVLTDSGWKPIQEIQITDLVHDGVEFVPHAGKVYKSVQSCVAIDGVFMTPDHEVLTDDGWKEASQLPRPYRPDLRGVDGVEPRGINREGLEVAVSVPVRSADGEAGVGRDQGVEARRDAELWVPHEASDFKRQHQARHVQASGVRGVEVHDRQVQATLTQGVAQLRRAWDNGVRAVAGVLRELLGGHGAFIPAWAGLGPQGQQRPVLPRELPVGDQACQHHEQAQQHLRRGRTGAESLDGHSQDHALQPAEVRLAPGQALRSAESSKPVYDILNCGPRQRFVVRGEGGPFVVHNCVQALARDTIADNAVDFFRATGLRPALMVHDELVYMVPESDAAAALETLQGIMRTPPKWWPQLITESEGDIANSYGAAK